MRPQVLISDVKVGTELIPDSVFSCVEAGVPVKIEKTPEGSHFFKCNAGIHHLDGQISEDGLHYVGLTMTPKATE